MWCMRIEFRKNFTGYMKFDTLEDVMNYLEMQDLHAVDCVVLERMSDVT